MLYYWNIKKMRQVLDHFPSQAGYEIQWHQSRGANPPYHMHSRGDGRRHRCDPNDVMGLFRSLLFSVQCCNTWSGCGAGMNHILWLIKDLLCPLQEVMTHRMKNWFVFACAAMVVSATASAHFILMSSAGFWTQAQRFIRNIFIDHCYYIKVVCFHFPVGG